MTTAITFHDYTGDGSDLTFDYTFPTYAQSEVKVDVEGVTVNNFTIPSYATSGTKTVTFDNTTGTLNTTVCEASGAPKSGLAVRVYRRTDLDTNKATFSAGSAIKAADLNDNNTQVLRATQETQTQTAMSVDIKDAAIIRSKIATDAVDGTKLADNAVNSEHYTDGSIDLVHMSANSVDSDQYVDGSIDNAHLANDSVSTGKIQNNAITNNLIADGALTAAKLTDGTLTTAKIAADAVTAAKIADSQVTTAKIAGDAVTGAKIADDSINSEHYVDGSIDTAHIADSQVTTAKIAADNITSALIADDQINSEHYVDGSIDTAHIADLNVTTAKIAADAITGAKIADDTIDSEHYAAGSIDTEHIAGTQVTTAKIASNAVTTAKITDANVTTVKIADSNVTIAKLASDLKSTSISDSDTQLPTSGAVVDYVAAQLQPFGGFEAIATEVAFPNTQPASGVVISIADAGGVVVNGSGTSTTGRTVGGTTVTINNIASNFNSSTVDAGVRFLVTSTGSGQIYNYHKATLKEADLLSLSNDINDFAARYRVQSGEPGSNNDEGDLVYDTSANKMKVYDGSSWGEVTSTGDFKYLVMTNAGTTNAATLNGSNVTFDLKETSTGGSAASVTSAAQLIVSVNGVIQKANTGTSASGLDGFVMADADTITFCAAPASGDDIFIIQIGSAITPVTPADGTVVAAKIGSGAVTTAKIADDAVTGAKIADDTIDSEHYAAGSVDAEHIAASAINDGKISSGAVITAKIADDAVTAAKIADDAVGAEHIEVLDANLQLADNAKIQVGTGNDLHIYHDGTNSHLTNNTGKLLLRSDELKLQNGDGTDTYLKGVDDGSCELYYNNDKTLSVESSRVDIKQRIKINNDGPNSGHGMAIGQWDGSNHRIESDSNRPMYIAAYNSSGIKMGVSGGVTSTVTANGITFNNDTAAANALSDYEEGTFNLTVTPGSGSYTYGYGNSGYYVKIGTLVHIQVWVHLSPNSVSGGITLGGLPFTVLNQSRRQRVHVTGYGWSSISNSSILMARLSPNGTTADIHWTNNGYSGTTVVTAGNLGQSAEIYINASYITE